MEASRKATQLQEKANIKSEWQNTKVLSAGLLRAHSVPRIARPRNAQWLAVAKANERLEQHDRTAFGLTRE